MEGLPFIPGYTFYNQAIQDHKLKQKFGFSNGIRIVRDSDVGIGRRSVDAASSAYVTENETVYYDPSLTYGRVKYYPYRQFLPHYKLYAQKCLCFKAFFHQRVTGSPSEHFRIRYVNIIYFLENDTLSVIEPKIDNVGFDQGRLVRKGKVYKNEREEYHWKDLNVGIDIGIFGVNYHTYDCDAFTREFMTSQGIDVGDKEEPPLDSYLLNRSNAMQNSTKNAKIPYDSRRRFLEYDGMVLLFDAIWEEEFYQILYFLTNDTISVKEIHRPNDGKDPVPMLLKKTKIPKNWKNVYPGISLENEDSEVVEYYSPKDLKIGGKIFIFGREFFLYDCDPFTRKYYSGMLGINQPSRIEPPIKDKKALNCKLMSHDYKPVKKTTIRQIFNFPMKLRYSMKMDAVHPEDESRAFILEYNLSEGKIQINECVKDNSGRRGGIFLSSRQIKKPVINPEESEYYGPKDFFIGAKIIVFNHHFIITGADLFVYRYIEKNSDKFGEGLKSNMRDYFIQLGLIQNNIDVMKEKIEEEKANVDLMLETKGREKDAYEMEECLKNFETETECEKEIVKFKCSTPPDEKLCSYSNQVQKEEKTYEECLKEVKDYLAQKGITWPDQIGQLMYEKATESMKSKFSAQQEKFDITPNFNLTLGREAYKAPNVS